MSTLTPRPPYSDAELAGLYPPHLQLRLVQVLLRHGERTPVGARFANTGLAAFWPYCSAVRHMRSVVSDPNAKSWGTLDWRRRLETFGAQDCPVAASGPAGELDAICDMGMLTDRGRETTFQLGQRLRALYVDRLAFLPKTLDQGNLLYLRATPIPRALESMQQTFLGLYPLTSRSPSCPLPTIVSRTPADETLFPNDSNCRRFAALARAFAQRAADRWNDSPEMALLTKKLGKWMPDDSPKVAVDSRPRLSGVLDTINSTNAHGPQTKLPREFYDPEVKRIAERIAVEEWFAGYMESAEYRTLGIGSLLGDIVWRMVGSAEHSASGATPSPPRLALSGCHDTTLAAVLASLGAYQTEAWPPFTSHIALELFRSTQPSTMPPRPATTSSFWPSWLGGSSSSSSIGRKPSTQLTDAQKQTMHGYFVRVRYNDEPVVIPGCKAAGNHLDGDESFCTLEAFKAIVDKFTPHDWKKQCRANVKAPVFPSEPQPAGQ
ncbi:hypothetical protein CDD81_6934 [Ophiocordyceps australis]|uniref:3-phytase n=1 Tax=Ophiocordyceps australis TaxID=1399860 RepID=A0A2C5XH89_9HYPO|nr:hypothetical protein CDD81_6934 [Ophiocordyceps australis]